MSDYNVTKKDPNRRYDVLDEIKVGENEDMLMIHGADIVSDDQTFVFRHYGEQTLMPHQSKIIGDLLEAKDKRIEELEAALKDAMEELRHAYIMGFTERHRDAARAANKALEKGDE